MKKKAQQTLFLYIVVVTCVLFGGNLYKAKSQIEAKVYAQKIISPIPDEKTPFRPIVVPTKAEIIANAKHSDIVYRIHYLESGSGSAKIGYHKGCEKKGQSNEFGYGVYEHICFPTFKDSVKKVDAWFDKTLKQHTLAQALCIYNTGKDIDNCKYSQEFLQK